MSGLAKADIQIDRKALSNMAIEDKPAFSQLVAESKKALGE
jgi:large subunit ribosomal protein L20